MKRKLYSKLWIYITVAVIPIIIFVFALTVSITKSLEYKDFLNSLRLDFAYATDNNSMTVKHNEIVTKIIEENIYYIEREIFTGKHYYIKEEPQIEEVILLEFGNGSDLKICKSNLSGVILIYNLSGKVLTFQTSETVRYVTFERLTSEEWDNPKISN